MFSSLECSTYSVECAAERRGKISREKYAERTSKQTLDEQPEEIFPYGDNSIFHYGQKENQKRLLDIYMGGIYLSKVCEVWTKFVSKFVANISTLESLIDIFKQASQLEKVFLFDVLNKYYICGDTSPIDPNYFELCWEAVNSAIDLAFCYCKGGCSNFDESFSTYMFLANDVVLCIKGMNRCVGVVYILRMEIFKKEGFIEHNYQWFLKGVKEMELNKSDSHKCLDTSDLEWSTESTLCNYY